jgi:hypothetical protein
MKKLVQLMRLHKNLGFIASFSSELVIPIKTFEPIIVKLNIEAGDRELTKNILFFMPHEANAYEIGNSHPSENDLRERFYPVVPYLINNQIYKREIKAKNWECHFS